MKIVGKLFLLFLALCAFDIHANVSLKALNLKGVPLKEAHTGVPFKLEVSVAGAGGRTQDPHIAGLEKSHVVVQGRRSKLQIINKQVSASYSFEVRIDEPGVYALGPAEVKDENNNVLHSNQLNLTVAQANGDNDAQQSEQKEPQAFIRLSVNKNRVVVGEQVQASVRFYFSSTDVELQHVTVPELKEFKVVDRGKPRAGKEKVNGVLYDYVEWQFDLYPNEAGVKVLPAYCADYAIPRESDERDPLAMFSGFFARRNYAKKRVYSNTMSLAIEALPPHSSDTQVVGAMRSFQANIKPLFAKEGEGIVLTLTLEGDIDWDKVDTLALQNLPDTFKYYDSKSYFVDDADSKKPQKKCFEYILQGMQAGDWEFTKQQFTYFDVNSRSYKTLETVQQPLTILAQSCAAKQNLTYEPSTNKSLSESEVSQAVDVPRDDLAPLLKDGVWYAQKSREIPINWFLFFCSVPLLIFGGVFTRKQLHAHRLKNAPQARKKFAFDHARSRLKKTQKVGDCTQLHAIFIELFAARLIKNQTEISQDTIEQALQESGVSDEQRSDWNHFFATIAALVFFDKNQQAEVDELFKQACDWLAVLEKLL